MWMKNKKNVKKWDKPVFAISFGFDVVVDAVDVGPELDCIDDLAEDELSPKRLSPEESSGDDFEGGQVSVDSFSFKMSSVTTKK